MKAFSLFSATLLGLVALSLPTHADEADAIPLTPQQKALLSQLLKSMDLDEAKEQPAPPPSTTPDGSDKATKPKHSEPMTSSLSTGSLRTGHLGTSASLGGHGTQGGTPRMTNDEWRQLFPQRR
jgi:hypothetical protein